MSWAIDRMTAMIEGEVDARGQRQLERAARRSVEKERERTDIRTKMGSSYFCNAIILFTTVTCLNYFYMLVCNITTDYYSYDAYLPWVISAMACYILLSLLLRRPRPVALVIAVLAVFLIAQSIVCLNYFGYYLDTGFTLLSLILFAFTYFRIYFLVTKKVILRALNNNFEIAVVFLVIGAIYSSEMDIPYAYLYPLAGAAILSLVAQIYERSYDGQKRERKIRALQGVTIAASAVFLLAVTLFALLVMRAPIKEAVYTILAWLALIWRYIAYGFSLFGAWLSSLFPSSGGPVYYEPDDSPYGEIMGSVDRPVMTGGEGGNIIFTVFFALLLLGLIAGAAVFLIRSGRRSVGGYRSGGAPVRKTRRRVSLGFRFAHYIKGKLVFAWQAVALKNTEPGLFVWLQRKYTHRRKGKQDMETCRAFIRRIARDYPTQTARFQTLANALDSLYYGDGSVTMDRSDIVALREAVAAKH